MAENEKLTEKTAEVETAAEKKADTKKADVAKKKKKPGFFAKIGKWIHDLYVEAKKVVWPTGKQVANNTLVVIVIVIIVCAFVALVDFVFGSVRDLIATLF